MAVIATVTSINGVPIRLSKERWLHVIEHHEELEPFQREIVLTIADPDLVYLSPVSLKPSYAAVKSIPKLVEAGLARNLIVHYREVSHSDGFILTALVMSDERVERRFRLWRRLR